MALVYSCCFWFSLRLGGILIGVFSLFQGMLLLIAGSVGFSHIKYVKSVATDWVDTMNLIYLDDFVRNFVSDPEKYLALTVSTQCIYIVICIFYIYGAVVLSTPMLIAFIVVEIIRFLLLSVLLITWLLILKQNTMDIGLLIGASIGAGFALLGMFYLWVCSASLPVVMYEMQLDQQAVTIAKLQQMLQSNTNFNTYSNLDDYIDKHYNPQNAYRGPYTVNTNYYKGLRVPERRNMYNTIIT